MKYRRTLYAFYYLEDDHLGAVAAMMRGELPPEAPASGILALALLTGQRQRLSSEDFAALRSVPAERWVHGEAGTHGRMRRLAEAGLLVSDAQDGPLAELRARDAALSANEWNLYAAAYHFMTQWRGVEVPERGDRPADVQDRSVAAARALVAEHGQPPPAWVSRGSAPAVALPGAARDGELYRTLLERRTTRAFDGLTPMELADLDTVLLYVFGAHGYARNAGDVLCIKRTSPSGGGLHPIEVYPLISNVRGLEPGFYHYNAGEHSLTLLQPMAATEVQRAATSFMCGQGYFGAAHVAFVLSARYSRNHWKYRRHQRAYAGILMDAAHLSQTLYLVSAERGLGAFVTIAINGRDVEDALGLDGISEGAVAMLGCGPRAAGESPLEPVFSATVPEA